MVCAKRATHIGSRVRFEAQGRSGHADVAMTASLRPVTPHDSEHFYLLIPRSVADLRTSVSRLDIGLQLGDDLLLANYLLFLRGGLDLVGGRFFHRHRVDPRGT